MSDGPAVTLFESFVAMLRAMATVIGVFAAGLLLGAIALLVGCAPPVRAVVKPQTVTVPVLVYKPLPSELTRPCRVKPAEPACSRNGKPELCNDQLLYERNAYRTELAGCDADKTEIRKLQPAVPAQENPS